MKRDLTALKAIIKADYHRHMKRFSMIDSPKDIVFIGDSLVAYYPLKLYGMEERITNFGIPGDTTKGVKERLEQVIRLKPHHVILHIGLNDEVLLEKSPDETAQNIMDIVSNLQKELPQVKITLISLTPINQTYFPHGTYVIDRNPQFSVTVNDLIREIDSVQFIDLYQQLLDNEYELDKRFTTDGIHLNKQGYDIYHNLIESIL